MYILTQLGYASGLRSFVRRQIHFMIIMFGTTSQTVKCLSTTFCRTVMTGAHRSTLRLDMDQIADSNDILHLRDAGIPLHPSSPHLQSSNLSITLDPYH